MEAEHRFISTLAGIVDRCFGTSMCGQLVARLLAWADTKPFRNNRTEALEYIIAFELVYVKVFCMAVEFLGGVN